MALIVTDGKTIATATQVTEERGRGERMGANLSRGSRKSFRSAAAGHYAADLRQCAGDWPGLQSVLRH